MANVYYLKATKEAEVNDCRFYDPTSDHYPDLQPGDLFFVRGHENSSPVKIKRLWKFLRFEDLPDGTKSAQFEPCWKDADGNEIFFDELELSKKFATLKLFQFDMSLGNYIHQPTYGKAFFKLSLVDESAFLAAIATVDTFNAYAAHPDHYRKVDVLPPASAFDPNSENIQIRGDVNTKTSYELHPATFIGDDVVALFDGAKPNAYVPATPRKMGTEKGKMYLHLKNGTGDYTLIGFYDLFCTQVTPVPAGGSGKKAKADAPEGEASSERDVVTEEGTTESTFEGMGGKTFAQWYDAPAVTDGENRILYGTPGCGKSYTLTSRLESKIADENNIPRVTFHQDYTYTDFVGQILPVLNAADSVEYKFDPGPFTRALAIALQNPGKKVALVIEEINRGNAASIFGDLFQLLDRKDNGVSEYRLTNWQITEHFKKAFGYDLPYIKIPGNLSLYATMNTGDQNVFTLDTAFKRRWKFEKLSNEFNGEAHKDYFVPGMNDVTWENFVKAINAHMIADGTFDSEDKQLGKFFVTGGQLLKAAGEISEKEKTSDFAYKVLEYLWNDVAKFDRERWFKTDKFKTLDSVIAAWKKGNGKDVFVNNIAFVTTKPVAVTPEETGDGE